MTATRRATAIRNAIGVRRCGSTAIRSLPRRLTPLPNFNPPLNLARLCRRRLSRVKQPRVFPTTKRGSGRMLPTLAQGDHVITQPLRSLQGDEVIVLDADAADARNVQAW